MPNGIILLGASASDAEQIIRIDPLRREKLIRAAIEEGHCHIAKIGGNIAGFAVIRYSFFEHGFVELLIVAEKYRRRDIGTALMNYLFDICATAKIFTSTNESNRPMREMLVKSGFTRCGQIDALDEGDPELFFVRVKGDPKP